MLEILHRIRAELAAIHPAAPAIALALFVGGLVWAWRRISPYSFERLPKRWQSLPSVLMGAGFAAASSGGDVGRALLDALAGAFLGLTAVGGHHALKAAPGPYLGGRWPAASEDTKGLEKAMASKRPPPLPPLTLLAAILLTGCPQNPACPDTDLPKIETAYHAELAHYCMGAGEDCPEKKRIDAKYKKQREDWVRCDGEKK